jgi:hypothetical protein
LTVEPFVAASFVNKLFQILALAVALVSFVVVLWQLGAGTWIEFLRMS